MKIAIEEIKTDCSTQMRCEINQSIVKEYTDLIDGDQWPFDDPIVVFSDGKSYWLADGFHRLEACKESGNMLAECEVKKGNLDDAQDYALQANGKHGLRRTNEDKKKAVEFALNCERWAKRSDNMIAKHIGVSQPFVGSIRNQLITVISCSERKGADGKIRKLPERQAKEVIPVTLPTPKTDQEPEFEYVYQDEAEPIADGDVDCGIVEASEVDSEPQRVDWKIKHKKTIAITETLIRAIDELNQYKPSNQKKYIASLVDSVWRGLKKW